ncbi:sterol desaturase family protein [Alsobacter sp. SYSU BS001988]|jgi:beta-carotene 3-hydroxylase
MLSLAAKAALVIGAVLAMEGVATLVHRYVMHGIGWGWHRSHHEPHDDLLERNDLYAVCFALLSAPLFILGADRPVLWWIGVGVALYGLLYFIVHDGLVHRRWPFRWVPRRGYLKHLVQAHRLHHAVRGRDGAVSFGFLYAAPLDRLVRQLRARSRSGGEEAS